MKEIWKEIKGYEGLYQVSNTGKIKSLTSNKIKAQQLSVYGYPCLLLYKNGARKSFTTHRLVAKSFIPNPENKPEVNHIDCDKTNNSVSNLEWVTRRENYDHARKNGLVHNDRFRKEVSRKNKGSSHGMSKLTSINVIEIRNVYRIGVFSQREIAEAYNICQSTVNKIIKRKRWKHV